jgi:glycosyltransferase involved in cell wall biosynthesis
MHSGVELVLSNINVGWFPLDKNVRQVHYFRGNFRAVAEAIRPLISYKAYLSIRWNAILERWSGWGKLCICNSEQTRDQVKRFYGYDGQTVWNPLDTRHFRPMDRIASRRALGLPERGPIGLFVGHAHPTKGFDVVQELSERLPHVQWVFALRERGEKNIRRDGNALIFRNASYQEMPLLYNAADFCICPSRYESFGYSVVEPLACGTPVIATPGGASRAFLGESPLDHLLIPGLDDRQRFQDVIADVLSDPAGYRNTVIQQIRPRLEELLAPENWWQRFLSTVGLNPTSARG